MDASRDSRGRGRAPQPIVTENKIEGSNEWVLGILNTIRAAGVDPRGTFSVNRDGGICFTSTDHVSFPPGQTQDQTQGQKRRREEGGIGEYERGGGSQRTRIRSPDRERSHDCGNCGQAGHQARDCVKVGSSGWMDGACPKCNRPGHMYEDCRERHRNEVEDLDYLFWYRQNKGPVKSSMNIGKLIKAVIYKGSDNRYRKDAVIAPPYTPQFALQAQRDYRWDSWRYAFVGDPRRESRARKYEPQFYGKTLREVANALDHPGWTKEHEEVKLEWDPPTPGPRSINSGVVLGLTSDGPRSEAHGVVQQPVERAAGLPSFSTYAQPSHVPQTINQGSPSQHIGGVSDQGGYIQSQAGIQAWREGVAAFGTEPKPRAPIKRSRIASNSRLKSRIKGWTRSLKCDNCGADGEHDTRECERPCRACGSDKHRVTHCDMLVDACVCAAYPRHLRADCNAPCGYCPGLDAGHEPHSALDCEKICNYCLSREHSMRKCPRFIGTVDERDKRGPCQHCDGDAYHLAASCVNKPLS
ncbi:hypothetical protein Hte_012568 [Hypoxylon texense]